MKYRPAPDTIPPEHRAAVNAKILAIIASGEMQSISPEDVFNAYSARGGNTGLIYRDFENFARYSDAKKELERGQFWTPAAIVEEIYQVLQCGKHDLLADLTCGHGAFANSCPNEANFYGCEIDPAAAKVARFLFPLANIETNDLQYYRPQARFDVIVGNPPFNIEIAGVLSQLFYFQRAAELLAAGGFLAVLTPESFLADEFRHGNMIKSIGDSFNFLGQYRLRRRAFPDADIACKISFWQRKADKAEAIPGSRPYANAFSSAAALQNTLAAARQATGRARTLLTLENRRSAPGRIDYNYACSNPPQSRPRPGEVNGFEFLIAKYTQLVKHHAPAKYRAAVEFVRRFREQTRPEHVSGAEWEKMRITQGQTLEFVKNFLRPDKRRRPANTISPANLRRRERRDAAQRVPFAEMPFNPAVAAWLDRFTLPDGNGGIRLTDIQKADINRLLQKRYGYLQWEQGSGKTLAGIAIGEYRRERGETENVIVAGPAIAVRDTWKNMLTQFGKPFRVIDRLCDLHAACPGEYLLLTLGMLIKHRRQIKKWLKIRNQKALLIFDEADNLSNLDTKVARAALDVFRRLPCKYLLSGTSTRNNIAESFPQFYLLYGSTGMFPVEAEYIYEENKNGEIAAQNNPWLGDFFPAFKAGQRLFSACFNPAKATVFGVNKFNQDVYNPDELRRLCDYTMLTRKFEEVRGEKIYDIEQVTVSFSPEEAALYRVIVEEFYTLWRNYFQSTGNTRKDSMLRIFQQILLLLKACSIPHKFAEFAGGGYSRKMERVSTLVEKTSRVAIGCIRVETVREYARMLRERYPGRPLFVITGESADIKKRREIVEKMKNLENPILVATQQSLSSSMNIDFIDDVIIPELNWNNPRMSQFYFRFIRFTSTRRKRVYFVTYRGSLESNLLQLILNKDRLNRFMKGDDLEMSALYEQFGIDFDLLEMVMTKERDEDDRTVIRWNGQESCLAAG